MQVVMLLAALIMLGGIVITLRLTRSTLSNLAEKEDAPAIFQKHSGLKIIEVVLGLTAVVAGYFMLNLPSQSQIGRASCRERG